MIFDFFMIKTRIPVNGKETRFFLDKDLWTPPPRCQKCEHSEKSGDSYRPPSTILRPWDNNVKNF